MADDIEAATLPAALAAELATITAAINPAVHSALASDASTTRIARVAAIACYEFAPCAPLEQIVEAAIRMGGWMGGWMVGTAPHVRDKSVSFPDGTSRAVTMNVALTAAPLRHSGASALLAPYRTVRGFEGF